jgi:hypothetical protein
MPVVFRNGGYRFFFFSNEGDPLEPLHIHVQNGEKQAKIWLSPSPVVAESYGINPAELRELVLIAQARKDEIERFWHEYFGF